MNKQRFKTKQRIKRKKRIRKRIYGDTQHPRLTVFRSLRHMYGQIIDDDSGTTLAAASTLGDNLGDEAKKTGSVSAAAQVGRSLARKALAVGIKQVRFDRNGYKYHGRVRAMGQAVREAGLVF